jgi:uroporphyrinogen-III synthase
MKKKLLLTRKAGLNQADQLAFEKKGYQVTILPLTAVSFLPLSWQSVQAIQQADWLFFTSQTPVALVLKQLERDTPTPKIAVIGKQTAKAVQHAGFTVAFLSKQATKRAFLAEWQAENQPGQTIFYPKSQLADDFLEKQLGTAHTVNGVVVYQNIFPKENQQQLRTLFEQQAFTSVYVTSPSAWRRFFQVYRHFLNQPIEIMVIGPTTQRAVSQDGFAAKVKI